MNQITLGLFWQRSEPKQPTGEYTFKNILCRPARSRTCLFWFLSLHVTFEAPPHPPQCSRLSRKPCFLLSQVLGTSHEVF